MVDSRIWDFWIVFDVIFVGLVCVVDYGGAIDFVRSELCKWWKLNFRKLMWLDELLDLGFTQLHALVDMKDLL